MLGDPQFVPRGDGLRNRGLRLAFAGLSGLLEGFHNLSDPDENTILGGVLQKKSSEAENRWCIPNSRMLRKTSMGFIRYP